MNYYSMLLKAATSPRLSRLGIYKYFEKSKNGRLSDNKLNIYYFSRIMRVVDYHAIKVVTYQPNMRFL